MVMRAAYERRAGKSNEPPPSPCPAVAARTGSGCAQATASSQDQKRQEWGNAGQPIFGRGPCSVSNGATRRAFTTNRRRGGATGCGRGTALRAGRTLAAHAAVVLFAFPTGTSRTCRTSRTVDRRLLE